MSLRTNGLAVPRLKPASWFILREVASTWYILQLHASTNQGMRWLSVWPSSC
jgi:hypothetical protein